MMSALGLGEDEEEESPWDSEVLTKNINEGAYFLTHIKPWGGLFPHIFNL